MATFARIEGWCQDGLQGFIEEICCIFDDLVHVIDLAYESLKDEIEHSDDTFVEGFRDIVERLEGSKSDFVFAVTKAVKDGVDYDEGEPGDALWEVIESVDDWGHHLKSWYLFVNVIRFQVLLSEQLNYLIDLS